MQPRRFHRRGNLQVRVALIAAFSDISEGRNQSHTDLKISSAVKPSRLHSRLWARSASSKSKVERYSSGCAPECIAKLVLTNAAIRYNYLFICLPPSRG